MFERLPHRTLRNFVKRHAANALVPVLSFFLLLTFLLDTVAEFFGQMRSNGFAFAVRVRREVDRVHADGQLLQLGDNFFFARNDHVLSLKIVIDIDPERALGQVLHVSKRSFDRVALPQIFLDGLRLGGRFDDDKSFSQIDPR